MSDIAIRVENLSKLYRIGQRERYKALRDVLTDVMLGPFRRLVQGAKSRGQRAKAEEPIADTSPSAPCALPSAAVRDGYIWALKDVSFEVKRGEVIGIIGRNGAGKSTLLKILSRITEPTEGYAEIHGRVGSLLEVGTGFHPELTGRENIYLNGSILGMKKAEIDRKFDEIVAFAEVEKFIDTPVKHYSSGMYMRLAFAVAAHLEPEILLVDEVLAVGDAAFQKKCLGKMGDVAKEGRTVLFVSHNMNAIRRLCHVCLLFDEGRLIASGSAEETVAKYLQTLGQLQAQRVWDPSNALGDDVARLLSVRVCNEAGITVSSIHHDEKVGVEVIYERLRPNAKVAAYVHFFNEEGIHLFGSADYLEAHNGSILAGDLQGVVRSICWVPGGLFREGRVNVTVDIADFSPALLNHAHVEEAVSFDVYADGDSSRFKPIGWPGVVWPRLEWQIKVLDLSSIIEAITE